MPGESRRAVHRCASLGVDVTGRPSWCVSTMYLLTMFFILIYDFNILLVNVHLPKDRISMAHQGYGFSEFLTEEDAEYACKIMNQIKLWGKPIRVNKVRCYSSELWKFISIEF